MKLGHGRRARRRPVGSASPAGPEPGTGRLAPPSPDELGGGALRRRAPRRNPPAGAGDGAGVPLASRGRDPSFRPFERASSASAATRGPDSSSEFRRLRVRVEAASQPRYSRRPLLPGEPGHGTRDPPSSLPSAGSSPRTSSGSVARLLPSTRSSSRFDFPDAVLVSPAPSELSRVESSDALEKDVDRERVVTGARSASRAVASRVATTRERCAFVSSFAKKTGRAIRLSQFARRRGSPASSA
jgi:hypothetical protein